MMRNMTTLIILAAAIVIVGCSNPEQVWMDEGRTEIPPIAAEPYTGPMPLVNVRRSTLGRTVDVRMTVPTGGHRLVISEVDVVQGEAMVFITLMRPAADEVVTMAYETLRATHETDRRFDFIRLYVRTHRRGVNPPREYQYAGQVAAE